MKEATARIKINSLLEKAGWRFFADSRGQANIQLEPSVTLKSQDLDGLGENFEKAAKGFIDFLLLNEKGFPFIVLEAKAEDKNPLVGKEQARKYARSQNCRFVILSNGNLHYFWDLERGNPYLITSFPTPTSVIGYQKNLPDPKRLIEEAVSDDYIVLTQRPGYASEAAWKNEIERQGFIDANGLRFLRPYQKRAVVAIQQAVAKGSDRFLLEMATGTGKTLVSAAIIKLFLRTGNASRVLFLVDRLELEDQALKAFKKVLKDDYKAVIYKENRDDWNKAEIVVTTVQSLLFNNKFQRLFSPTDFDLVISDEAHRSIGGNARSVFDYFIGYKLGLTATPFDYLKKYNKEKPTTRDPREFERRLMLDTYRTFGCTDGQPTFRYSLLDGVKDGFLINPTVVDARSEVTTKLLSDEGFVVEFTDIEGGDQKETYKQREFEKRFFSEATNQLFCKVFLENALRDPISGEIGKSIIFAVSQHHAAKLAQVLNEMADRMFPGKYQSDFAVQVTSQVDGAQQHTINFTNNNLLGSPFVFWRFSESSVMRFMRLFGCNNDRTSSFTALVKDRNNAAHTNGQISYSTQAALDVKIREILRVVEEIQSHSGPTIQRCYVRFLDESNHPDDREYSEDADQIREVLIHAHYLSQKDIEICAAFNIADHEQLKTHSNFAGIESLHQALRATYTEPEVSTTA